MIDFVVRGQSVTFEAFFYQDGTNNPLITVGGVTFSVKTPAGLTIASGVAIQDILNAARWTVTFSIPATAPLTAPNERYLLNWRGASVNQIVTQVEQFPVVDPASPDPINTAVIAIQGSPFNVNLVLPYNNISSLSLRILDMLNQPVITLTDLLNVLGPSPAPITPVASGGNWVYTVPIDTPDLLASLPIRANGYALSGYLSYFNYTDAQGNQLTEVQPIFLVNAMILQGMNDLRQFVDMLRNNDAIIELRITELKLVHFLGQGFLRLNATSPANFVFSWQHLQMFGQFYFWMLKCAQYELLSALYLAEGMTSFDFQGMTVQLNSDRTQYIQSLMSDIKSDLDNMLPKVKSQYARSGGMTATIGTIGGVWGPASNWVFRATPFNTAFGPLPVLPFLS